MSDKKDYKNTLNLPQTDFPMKADLAKREPQMLAFWKERDIYRKRQAQRRDAEKFILHDGPPYANGHLHIGHALNKILKDIVLKSKALSGFDTPFVPGWDCHGLPIELNVEKQLAEKKQQVSAREFRKICRDYAKSQIDIQREEFKRLGVFGEWENPYITMEYTYEADIIRALAGIIAKGHLLRGKKPVYWCVECGSALAEAEVEYKDKTSLAIDVSFNAVDPKAFLAKFDKYDFASLHSGSRHPAGTTEKELHSGSRHPAGTTERELHSGSSYPAGTTERELHAGSSHPAMTERELHSGSSHPGRMRERELQLESEHPGGVTTAEILPVSVVIWTTTPWTLPANQAVALNPNIEYALVRCEVSPPNPSSKGGLPGAQYLIVAATLVEGLMQRWGITHYHIDASCIGEALEGLLLQHPFLQRQVPIILGEHVTVDAGTGAVHTAPAHGQDDYVVGNRYGLEMLNPVNAQGCFVEGTPFFAGEHVYKVNEHIVEVLKEPNGLNHGAGALLFSEKITHSYPHCWRHKIPLIFRATPQWFVGMDKNALRTQALAAIDHVQWSPDWAQARIADMVLQRPDWCISRQRLWGTPITLFIHKDTEELHPKTLQLMEEVACLVEKDGVDAWYDLDPVTLLGADASQYQKVSDTLDVWFDSGVSHRCVLARRPELRWPADMYLEGSDQYRGWFQSSLLTATAIEGTAPYRIVISYGFTVDSQGRKMSKSLGNVLPPEKIWNTLGAEIIRLWAAATDYRSEASFSDEIFQRNSETYRRIRNTARFLLSNLFDFNPKEHLLPFDQLLALDSWAISRAYHLQEEIKHDYDNFQFHLVTQKLQQFCSIDMGSFYLDVIKDRQYTTQKNSRARRSAQTAMYHILEALVRWLSPILSFTAEEIWQYMPWRANESVFFNTWYQQLNALSDKDEFSHAFWEQLMQVRDCVNRELEKARNASVIGSALAAEVTLFCTDTLYHALQKLGKELKFVFITSSAAIYPESEKSATAVATDMPGLWLSVQASTHEKCARCWHRVADVGQNADHPGLCGRCVENVVGEGEKRLYA